MSIKISSPAVSPVIIFETITLANLLAKIAASTLIPGATYAVQYIESNNYTNCTGIFKAIDVNKIDPNGAGLFFNADYNLRVYEISGIYAIGQKICWNNYHYENLTGVNSGTYPDIDLVNWQFLPGSLINGYLPANDVIYYDIATDFIQYRSDNRGNIFSSKNYTGSKFIWGSNVCENNNIINSDIFICNSNDTSLQFNTIQNETVINTGSNNTSAISFEYCTIIKSTLIILDSSVFINSNISNLSLSQSSIFTVVQSNIFNVGIAQSQNFSIYNSDLEQSDFSNILDISLIGCKIFRNTWTNINNTNPGIAQIFTNCIFNDFFYSSYTCNGFNCDSSYFNKKQSIFSFEINFTGGPGEGLMGILNIFNFPILADSFINSVSYNVLNTLFAVNPLTNITIGVAAWDPNAGINDLLASLNSIPQFYRVNTAYLNTNIQSFILGFVNIDNCTAGRIKININICGF